jgi:putative ABC transport system permease protein
VLQDIRHAVRLLLKNPGFSAVAVLVLALGIGANTAAFSLVNALMLEPMAAEGPGIVGIYSRDTTQPDSYRAFSYADYEQVRANREPFDTVMAYTVTMLGVSEGDTTRRSFSAIVSSSYFSTLNVRLAAGREFSADEERPESDQRVVIVGHRFARAAGVEPGGVIGRTVRLNARDYEIVGVAPEGFSGTIALVAPEFWLPLGVYAKVTDEMIREGGSTRLSDPRNRALMLVGRLHPGLDVDGARPMIARLSQSFVGRDPVENKDQEITLARLARTGISTKPQSDSELTVLSTLLIGMASLVLLIACLNLTNMMLARGTARRKEIALRLALGSGRGRVIRQLLTENLLLAVVGSAAGLLLATWGAHLLVASLASALPFVVMLDTTPDVRVLGATVGFCVLATVVSGLGPAWRVTRPDVLPDLKEQPAQEKRGRTLSMRNVLVVGQIALSLALLMAAGLFMRGAIKAAAADPGFPLDGGVIANVDAGMAGYDETNGRGVLRGILQRVRNTSGVRSASFASLVPFGDYNESRVLQKAGTPAAAAGQPAEGPHAVLTIVGADYFDTLRLPILRGRGFTSIEEESPNGPRVAIIDEPAARRLFGDEDPVGHAVQFAKDAATGTTTYTIVGVVTGVRHDLVDRTPVAHVYLPIGQHYRGHVYMHVRLAGEGVETAMFGALREAIRAADPRLPVLQMLTLRQQRDRNLMLWAVNSGARLFSVFAAVALLLAIIGVYGVKSYVVSRRTREIGIRMALGATRSSVLWLVLREGLTLTLAGIGVGLLLAWGVARALSGLLYEVSALDPLVFAVAPVVLAASAVAASYVPALRATRVVPLTALRME